MIDAEDEDMAQAEAGEEDKDALMSPVAPFIPPSAVDVSSGKGGDNGDGDGVVGTLFGESEVDLAAQFRFCQSFHNAQAHAWTGICFDGWSPGFMPTDENLHLVVLK